MEVNVFSEACLYEITLQGKVSPTLLRIVDDLQVELGKKDEIKIVGRLSDQSALLGIIQSIHNIHYGILSITTLPSTNSTP
jgi:ABC-type uncharacterized transport system permease subunit